MSKLLKNTPWGKPQSVEVCNKDLSIVFYSTASHGGYKISPALNRQIPEIFRFNDGWYEEDCQSAIVHMFLSAYFDADKFDLKWLINGRETMFMYFPHEWQIYNGLPVAKVDKCMVCTGSMFYSDREDCITHWNKVLDKQMSA